MRGRALLRVSTDMEITMRAQGLADSARLSAMWRKAHRPPQTLLQYG
jgi:hypothetical protein